MQIKQSTATIALVFYMADSSDHVTGKTGLVPTVTISKNGAAFAAPAGAVSEIGAGFYRVAANATDSNTLGLLALSAISAGADQAAMAFDVVANVESDSIAAIAGLNNLSAADAADAVWSEVIPEDYANGSAGAAVGRLNNTQPDSPVVIIPDPADDSGLCVVYVNSEEINNAKTAGITIEFKLVSGSAKSERMLLVNKSASMTTDADGFASTPLQRNDIIVPSGSKYIVNCKELGLFDAEIELATDTFNLIDLIS